MENQPQDKSWIDKELELLNIYKKEILDNQKPYLNLEVGKITEFTVLTFPFDKKELENGKMKAIIPVSNNKENKDLWLNVKNPLYSRILENMKAGVYTFRVFTRKSEKGYDEYTLLKDDGKTTA